MSDPSPTRLQLLLERLRGRPVVRDLTADDRLLRAIGALETDLHESDDSDLLGRATRLREAVASGTRLDSCTVEGFALVREAARRTIGERPFDSQILAGLALLRGNVAEMATGEGKTLAAVAPVWLHALAGHGAHVLTFNDYLARRDAEWMRPVYELLGLSVGVVQEGMTPEERRRSYGADVTYATAKEAGFDYLRGFLARDPADLVHRLFHFAIVDEADSILIDEARIPLVIAGRVDEPTASGHALAIVVGTLDRGVHFDTDDNERNVNLTDAGYARLEEELACGSLIEGENLELLTRINCALHALVLLRRDVDYIVRNGRIELVDEFTGRVVEDRHLPDGLQAAVCAKEGLDSGSSGAILGSITLLHFFEHYPTLAGMTATANEAAEELHEFYGMQTVVVPPNRPSIRVDHPDLIFTHREAKNRALIEEIRKVHEKGRPVLVGTVSVEESEELAGRIRKAGIDCEVLNARRDDVEAEIVAEAGRLGAVTISTNMAGRGTDIKLGGRDEAEREGVVARGGLYVIGTNRHESRRIDDQLRGRAGRQGDPGESRFLISLEDPLISRFGVNRMIPDRFRPEPQDDPVDHPVLRREIARAQRIVDNQNLDIRRTISKYSRMIEEQRSQIHARRQQVLMGEGSEGVLATGATRRYEALLAQHGPRLLDQVEREITLAQIDRVWTAHLAHAADLRESIHLMNVARLDPLAEFQREMIDAWSERFRTLDAEIVATFERAEIGPDGVDLEREGLKIPTSTWTYLVSDDPFRDQLMARLGGTTMGIAMVLPTNFPLVAAWWLYVRFVKRKKKG